MKSGRDQLHDWIARHGVNQRKAADLLDMNEVHLGQILNGIRRAGLDTAIKIEDHTGIPVKSWGRGRKRTAQPAKRGDGKRPSERVEAADKAGRE